jgi:opacity protein-like surface antigen
MADIRQGIGALLCAAVFLLMFPHTARSQDPLQTGGWSVSPLFGGALDPDADGTLTLGAAIGYNLTPRIIVEGELAHAFDMAPDDADVDSSLTSVSAAVLYHFEMERFIPYLAAGLGVGRLSHEVVFPPADIKATEVGFNLGAGVGYPITERTRLRGDFRYFSHTDNVPDIWRFVAAITFEMQ